MPILTGIYRTKSQSGDPHILNGDICVGNGDPSAMSEGTRDVNDDPRALNGGIRD